MKVQLIYNDRTQALFVPSQGFLNALVYGWTRGDFLSVMSRDRPRLDSLTASSDNQGDTEEDEEEEETEDEREDWERQFRPGTILLSSSRAHDSMTEERRQRRNTALTPLSPGGLLRDV